MFSPDSRQVTIYPVMVNAIRASDIRVLNKGRGLKFREGSRIRQEIPEKGRRTYRPERYEYKNKDEDNSLKTLNDKAINHIYPTPGCDTRSIFKRSLTGLNSEFSFS